MNRDYLFKFLVKPCNIEELTKVIDEGLVHYNEMKLLKEKSISDSMTSLYNHNEIIKRVDMEIERCERHSSIFSIAMLDIDFFKKVNDTFGHLTGDCVIKKVSSIITDQLRKIDMAGRYGGEEFLVILPEANKDNAYMTLERIRKSVENILWDPSEVKITISGGIAQYYGEKTVDLIKKADDFLYKAKTSGRNRIEV